MIKHFFPKVKQLTWLFCSILLFLWGSFFFHQYQLWNQAVQQEAQTLAQINPEVKKKAQQCLEKKARWHNLTSENQQLILLNQAGQALDAQTKDAKPSLISQIKQQDFTYQVEKVQGQYQLTVLYPIIKDKKTLGYLEIIQKPLYQQHFLQKEARFIFLLLCFISFLCFYFLAYEKYKKAHIISETKQFLKKAQQATLPASSLVDTDEEWRPLFQSIEQTLAYWQEKNQQSEAETLQFMSLINDLQVGIFVLNERQHFSFINPNGRRLLHLSIHNEPTRPLNSDLIALMQKCMHQKADQQQEIYLHQPKEQVLYVSLRYLTREKECWILGSIYDITHLRKVETMQEDFVSNVSHELKTPITSLIGFIETLLDGALEEPETAKEFLKIMEKDAQRLKVLIQEIIQLSRNGQELNKESKTPVQLASLIQNLIQSYQGALQEKNIQVHLNVPPTLYLQTYLYYFEPIIKNLIENAIIYNRPGGSINIQVKAQEDKIFIQIKDTGIGIAHKDLQRIFERFYRVDKARSRNLGGTGLGLAIVKHYTDLLQGQVQVQSQVGVGTCFQLFFPKTS